MGDIIPVAQPKLIGVRWAHAVAAVVEDAAGEDGGTLLGKFQYPYQKARDRFDNRNTPIKTPQKLIAYAKADPKKLSFSSSGVGTRSSSLVN